jgi:hypothetical protein
MGKVYEARSPLEQSADQPSGVLPGANHFVSRYVGHDRS